MSTLKKKNFGRMVTDEGLARAAAAPRLARRRGRITPTDVEAGKKDSEDSANKIPVARADVISGIVAASVSTNRLMPISNSLATWDVYACHYAVLNSGFTGFRMPTAGAYMHEYAAGLEDAEFDELAFDLDPKKQNLLALRTCRDFAMIGVARCDQAGLNALIDVDDPVVHMNELRWAGPWDAGDQYLMSLQLDPHVTPDAIFHHTPTSHNIEMTVPPAHIVEAGDHALVEILFLNTGGSSTWQAYPTRVR